MDRSIGGENSVKAIRWTDEEKKYLAEIACGRSRAEITDLMNERFDRVFTKNQVGGALKRNGIKTGFDSRFKKGHIPHNKGRKGFSKVNKGCFSKGNKPHNTLPVGSERVNRDGYVEVKVKDYGNYKDCWQLKHRFIYEKHYGSIPSGSIVIFGDGDKSNLSIDNLILVTRSQLARLNQNRLIQDDVELTKTAINVVDLMCKISQVKKSNKR